MLKKTHHFMFLFFFLLSLIHLTGCVDLSGTQRVFKAKTSSSGKKIKPYRGVVHTMRGGLGIFSIGMNQLSQASAERFDVPSSSIMWYHAGKVSQSIIQYHRTHASRRPVVLIGHSLGANEQIKVARRLEKAGITVDLLVTVDAVSQTRVPANVKQALNVYQPGYVPMFSGLKLKAVNPKVTSIHNVDVTDLKGVHVNHFTIDKHQVVQEMILAQVEKVLRNAKNKESEQRRFS